MSIKRFFIFIVTIAFIVIDCNPVFFFFFVSVMGEVYHGDGGEIDSIEKKLKSPQDISSVAVIKLNEENMQEQRTAVANDLVPNQIGFSRQIESLSEHSRLKKRLNWLEIEGGGHTATIIISSPGAKALRVGIIVNKLPQETELRFFQINNETSGLSAALITGKQINHLLQLNREADPDHPDSETYWSPTVEGESIGIEIYLPPGIHPDNFDIAIPFLSHLFVSPFVSSSEFLKPQSYGESDSCQNDATCYSSWLDERNSVAHMVYTESGESYICTGTLLNDTDTSTEKPYFITANHCIDSQTVASTLETHWFFESALCNSTIRNSKYTIKYGGAKLHWTKGMTTSRLDSNQDVTFLELNDTPPGGASFAGWSTTMDSDTVTGIHHPQGDWKKISFGNQGGDYKCYWVGSDGDFSCTSSPNGSFRRIDFTDGGTEGGSSGSGLFNDNYQLIGTLTGGSGGPCASQDDYSKFGTAYSAGNLSQWLDPSVTCTYTILPSSGSFASSGGISSVSVTASSSSCGWTASESLSWVSLSPTSGTGSGSVAITAAANTGAARTGSITIAGKTYTVSQQSGVFTKITAVLTNNSPNLTINAGTDARVYGTASSNQITLASGARAELINFPGQNSIQIQASSTLFSVSRSGAVVTFEGSDKTVLKIPATASVQTISFNDQSLMLSIYNNQVMLDDQVIGLSKSPISHATSCTYGISPSSGSFTSSRGTSSVSVTASSSTCAWTASESLSWVSLSRTSGTGRGSVYWWCGCMSVKYI